MTRLVDIARPLSARKTCVASGITQQGNIHDIHNPLAEREPRSLEINDKGLIVGDCYDVAGFELGFVAVP